MMKMGTNEMQDINKCLEAIGYNELTYLQKKAFNTIYNNKFSTIVVAPTGSGKTEAAMIPVFYDIMVSKRNPISAIYITPLRALNRDITLRLKRLGKCFGVNVELRHGDTPYSMRKKIARTPPHVLITTPETFTYIVLNETLRKHLRNLRYIIIDELRDLVESKRGVLLLSLIYFLQKLGVVSKDIIKIGLTATLVRENDARQLLEGNMIPVKTCVIREKSLRRLDMDLYVPKCDELCEKISKITYDKQLSARIAIILRLIKKYRHVLIFVNTRSLSEKLSYILDKISNILGLDIRIGVHHGSLSRKHRLQIEDEFRHGNLDALVATSSMELGIDIGLVNYVIQYMSPRQTIRLVQRIGRSGHKLYGVGKGCIIPLDNPLEILESYTLIKRAEKNILERENITYKPLDVLAYVISVLSLIKPNGIRLSELYELIIGYPLFNSLDYTEFEKVIEYLEYSRIIYVRDSRIYPTRKTRLYLYKTSMIPETRDIPVVEVSTGNKVGVLNEEYVLININPGDPIVLGGKLWKVVEYDKDTHKLYVERLDAEAPPIIPHWEGENIPVEYGVARYVGAIIRMIATSKTRGYPEHVQNAVKELTSDIDEMFSDKRVIVEYIRSKGLIVVYLTGGTRINNLLKEILRFHIKLRYPIYKINAYSTPYYIVFQSCNIPLDTRVYDLIYELIASLYHLVSDDIRSIVRKTSYYYWRIYQVGQRFGAIDPAADKITRNLLDRLGETIIGDEALNEVLTKDFDLRGLIDIARKIEEGQISVTKIIRQSINDSVLKKVIKHVPILAENVGIVDYNAYKDRILSRKIKLICINCGYTIDGRVKDLVNNNEKFSCPRCGLRTLAPLKILDDKTLRSLEKWKKGRRLRRDERKIIDDLKKRALLLTYYGRIALILLASPGVGVTEAIKILRRASSEDEMYKLIYESEKNYLKIKKFLEKK